MLKGPVRTRTYPGNAVPTGTWVAGSTAQPGAARPAVKLMKAAAIVPTISTPIAMWAAIRGRTAVPAIIAMPPITAITNATVPAVADPGYRGTWLPLAV